MSSSESEDELSHFKPSGLLYSYPEAPRSTSTNISTDSSSVKTASSSTLLKYYGVRIRVTRVDIPHFYF